MCGIVGFLNTRARGQDAAVVAVMAGTLAHRGPDADGQWVSDDGAVALGHRRLAILDLSPAGAQPMRSPSGRYVLAYNGEVYNFAALQAQLGGAAQFRGHSDTEVLAAGFDVWGIEGTVERSVGMFAMAVWDRAERTLVLARDRMGQKPLYYGWAGPSLVFGSELKALRAHPGFEREVDRESLALYFAYAYVPAPRTIYRGARQLPPGTIARVPLDGLAPGADLGGYERAYWSLADAVRAGQEAPFRGTDADAADALEAALRQAVEDRLVADVPVGAFLSGGVDSTAVVAAAQQASPGPVRTFTIGFAEAGYDESGPAAAVAAHLGTDHKTLRVTSAEAQAVIPRLGTIYDEPFADSSQIPTTIVARLARSHVTVALSGDGGDELFGGYTRHVRAPRLWDAVRRVPGPARRAAGRTLQAIPERTWDRAYDAVSPVLPRRARLTLPGNKVHKFGRVLGARSFDGLYAGLVRAGGAGWPPVLGAGHAETLVDRPHQWPAGLSPLGRMLYLDACTYLPGDILTKVDRATMAASLEGRAPFMDHRLVEFAWTLPDHLRVRAGEGKWLLRRVVDRSVPRVLMDRPKAGFAVPVDDWLRGPLRDWAEGLLDPTRLRREGVLDAGAVAAAWRAHLGGEGGYGHGVWAALMFQAWAEAGGVG